MKVTCQACSAQYTIADDKVKGRKVKIRCKACQTPIVVDGQNPPPDAGSGASEPPPALDPFAPETAIAPEADVWNVNLSDTDSRTMTTAEVLDAFRNGVVTTDAFVWKDGMADWVAIMDCVELAPLLAGPTDPPAPVAGQTPYAPPVAPAAAAPAAASKLGGMPMLAGAGPAAGAASGGTAARAATAKAQPSADLFGDIDAAGSEGEDSDVATSARAPALPGAHAYDDKPTGQRNENSVLFSLDSLKAGFVGGAPAGGPEKAKPPAPKPGAPRPSQPSNPDDPFGMGAAGGLASLGSGGNPLFSLGANQALLTAPAPPEPKPVVVRDYSAATAAGAGGMDPKTKRMVTFGGIGLGAVILLLIGYIAFGGDDEKAQAEADAKAAASAAALAKKDEAPKDEPKPEEKKEEPKPAVAASAEPKKEDAKADAKAEPAKPGGGGGVVAPKKEEPAAETAAASSAPPFSKAAAISALGGAAGSAGACKKPGGPTGTGKVQVTFAPSGRVTNATVMGGPFAGTAVGGCVAAAFRRAKVPAFSGNAVTVSKSFAIN
jgi:predicted Zn finger-like uncharacterized protein